MNDDDDNDNDDDDDDNINDDNNEEDDDELEDNGKYEDVNNKCFRKDIPHSSRNIVQIHTALHILA